MSPAFDHDVYIIGTGDGQVPRAVNARDALPRKADALPLGDCQAHCDDKIWIGLLKHPADVS